jgi:hypothetical protein
VGVGDNTTAAIELFCGKHGINAKQCDALLQSVLPDQLQRQPRRGWCTAAS